MILVLLKFQIFISHFLNDNVSENHPTVLTKKIGMQISWADVIIDTKNERDTFMQKKIFLTVQFSDMRCEIILFFVISLILKQVGCLFGKSYGKMAGYFMNYKINVCLRDVAW